MHLTPNFSLTVFLNVLLSSVTVLACSLNHSVSSSAYLTLPHVSLCMSHCLPLTFLSISSHLFRSWIDKDLNPIYTVEAYWKPLACYHRCPATVYKWYDWLKVLSHTYCELKAKTTPSPLIACMAKEQKRLSPLDRPTILNTHWIRSRRAFWGITQNYLG